MNAQNLKNVRKQLGFVFQDPDDQLFMNSVFDDVAFGPRQMKLSPEAVDLIVQEALESVGIAHLKDRAPYKLSGGEKRAAAIASVLAMSPDVLIMDEPSAALDPKSRRRVIELMNRFDHTKIITSHDLDLILDTCSRVILMSNGHVAADGDAHVVLKDKALLEANGLELPLSVAGCSICKTT